MTVSVPDQQMAWRGADLRKDEIAFDLTRRHAAALEELLGRFRKRGLGLGQILPENCRHPALDADLAGVFDEIQEGRGIVIVRGGEAEQNRLMLRLSLDVERTARPVVPHIHIYENKGGRSGIDPQLGRLPAVAAYRAPDELVRQPAAAR